MATPAEIKQRILPRVMRKVRDEFSWSDLVSAVQVASASDKAAIINGIQAGSTEIQGRAIERIAEAQIRLSAENEIDTMLADGNVDLTEWDRIL